LCYTSQFEYDASQPLAGSDRRWRGPFRYRDSSRESAVAQLFSLAMEYRKENNGWLAFLEHWNIAIVAVLALATSQALGFFMQLQGTSWIWCFVVSFVFMIFGGVLIVYAKLPVYRSGRFFTFGLNSVPEHLRASYRWGWRAFLFGVVLALGLLLSTP